MTQPTHITFDKTAWGKILDACMERYTGHHSFDADRYALLLEAESEQHQELASPLTLVRLQKQQVFKLLEKCEVQPVGHRVAVYAALHTVQLDEPTPSVVAAASIVSPPKHFIDPISTASSPQVPPLRMGAAPADGPFSGNHSTTNTTTSKIEAMTAEKFAKWIRTASKATIVSRLDDVHVQLLRPNTIGKRVRVGGGKPSAGSPKQPVSNKGGGAFDLDTEFSFPTPRSPNSEGAPSFTWVDVVGTWSTSVAPTTPILAEPPLAFASKFQKLREYYTAPKDALSDERLQRVMLASSPQRGYQTTTPDVSMPRFSSVQHATLESVLRSVEMEYGIELPLSAIARRVQDPNSYKLARENQRTSTTVTSNSTLSKKRITERIRHRIEESVSLNYVNASIFAEDELRDLRAECASFKRCRRSHTSVDETTFMELKERQLQEENKILEELSQQHMFVLRTATAPFGSIGSTAFFAPTGSEQHSDLMKTNHNQLALMFSQYLEQQGKTHANSDAYVEPWVLYVDMKQNLVVTVRPRDTVVIGRIHNNFDACFTHLPFTDFVGIIIEANVLHTQTQVDSMYATLDEVQRFLAPSSVRRVMRGDTSALSETDRLAKERRRKFNVRSYDPTASNCMNRVYFVRAMFVRAVRSVWRKLRRRKTRPRDMTLAALRLLNLVNRQASVFGRTMSDAKRLTEFARVSMCGGCVPQAGGSRMPKQTMIRSTIQHDHSIGGRWGIGGSHSHQHPAPLSPRGANARGGAGDCCLDDNAYEDCLWAQESQRLADETTERCRQLRHLTGELMSLAMALDAETYDENLSVIGFVTALFAPMGYWAANMGVNFRCPLFHDEHGYLATWVVYAIFAWLLTWWFYNRYHTIDIAEVVTRWVRWLGSWTKRKCSRLVRR